MVPNPSCNPTKPKYKHTHTHIYLQSSLEGVTPTEVRSSLTFSEALTLFRFVAHSPVSVYLKLQVHTGGQPVLPVPCHSFVASGKHGEPDAPAIKGKKEKT